MKTHIFKKKLIIVQQMNMRWKSFKNLKKLKKSDIIWLAYHQGQIFQQSYSQKVKEKERFISMVLKYNVNKSTIVFKVALGKQIDNHPKMKNLSLSIHYFKKHLQTIREVCKENAREFKKTIKICLKTLAFLLHWFCFIWNFNHAVFIFLINKKSHVAFLSSTCGSFLSNICGSIFE